VGIVSDVRSRPIRPAAMPVCLSCRIHFLWLSKHSVLGSRLLIRSCKAGPGYRPGDG